MQFYGTGSMRMQIEKPEEHRMKTSKYVVTDQDLSPAENMQMVHNKETGKLTVTHKAIMQDNVMDGYKSEGMCKYVINTKPFFVECYFNDQLTMIVNNRQLFNYEQYRHLETLLSQAKDAADLLSPLMLWEQNSLHQTFAIPKGPSSVAMDFSFNGKL